MCLWSNPSNWRWFVTSICSLGASLPPLHGILFLFTRVPIGSGVLRFDRGLRSIFVLQKRCSWPVRITEVVWKKSLEKESGNVPLPFELWLW